MEKKLHPVLRVFAFILRFLDYFAGAALIVIFALFCSARVGYFLLLALFGAPLLSVLAARLFRAKITASAVFSGTHIGTGEEAVLTLTLKNRLPLPTPPVEVRIRHSFQLSCADPVKTVWLLPREERSVLYRPEAIFPGGALCAVEEIRVWDYFHFMSFSVKTPDLSFLASVLPQIPEIRENHPVLEQAMISAFQSGDSDETSDMGGGEFGGVPGYEYREYRPGDPLKRIAGKLSARTGKLMVRLDDKHAVSGICLILDPVCKRERESYLSAIWYRELCETALGMTLTLLSKNFSVRFFFCKRSGWQEMVLLREQELSALAEELSEISFDVGIPERFGRAPGAELYPGGETFLYFTADPDGEARQELLRISGGDLRLVHIYDASAGEGEAL
ncbi:MAG: DUF58 domain-containing protein [Lachnospiraceae bacterium]|nr:DUF58 domain-containing protein [Lachnospiraceae bacterium]